MSTIVKIHKQAGLKQDHRGRLYYIKTTETERGQLLRHMQEPVQRNTTPIHISFERSGHDYIITAHSHRPVPCENPEKCRICTAYAERERQLQAKRDSIRQRLFQKKGE